jgi:hypothetical protein
MYIYILYIVYNIHYLFSIHNISIFKNKVVYSTGVVMCKTNVCCDLIYSAIAHSKAPFTLYRIASERSDFHTGFGCCLHYATVIRYATRSKNHSALEVI